VRVEFHVEQGDRIFHLFGAERMRKVEAERTDSREALPHKWRERFRLPRYAEQPHAVVVAEKIQSGTKKREKVRLTILLRGPE